MTPNELRERLSQMRQKLDFLRGSLDLPRKRRRIEELGELSNNPDFWADNRKARALTTEKSSLETEVKEFEGLERGLADAHAMFELAEEADDADTLRETSQLVVSLDTQFDQAEFRKMLSEEADPKNAIVTINAGAGGTESQDWAQMLLRMYQRWGQDKGFKVSLLDALPGEEAGIKNATLTISGPYAYGQLKSEAGVHRLVRISPFDSNARRHTSFSSVYVTPEVDDDFEVVINPADLRIDVYRSGGKGGQGVNTTDSAVRITHIPTNTVVTCQQERSQIKNRDLAMKVLRSRLYEKHLEEERKKQAAIEDAKKDIAWGSQIRSYVLHPYKMVKDHRTGHVVPTAEKTLDGELDGFIKAFLTCRLTGEWVRGGSADDNV
ncbi:MAG TPA: peptide chain release factor 2 [Bdellovibrionota bacterium]|nr:peptide chain release factor 2 [Bdellovibrionota bacterium]